MNTIQLIERVGNNRANNVWEARLDISQKDKPGNVNNLVTNASVSLSPSPMSKRLLNSQFSQQLSRSMVSSSAFDSNNNATNTPDISVHDGMAKPIPTSARETKEQFIIGKYVKRNFVPKMSSAEACALMYRAASIGDLNDLMLSLAAGSDVNYRSEIDRCKTALHAACLGGHILCVEYLCQNNASVDVRDEDGKTPIDYATQENNEGILDILVLKLERDIGC